MDYELQTALRSRTQEYLFQIFPTLFMMTNDLGELYATQLLAEHLFIVFGKATGSGLLI